jgi:hypothetical protein
MVMRGILRRLSVVMGLGFLNLACAASRYAGPPQSELDASLRKRASFDLSCKSEELTVTPLVEPNAVGIITSQGVTGCGKKASYVLRARSESGEWILNSTAEPVAPSGTNAGPSSQ